jgi:hypothetical protein
MHSMPTGECADAAASINCCPLQLPELAEFEVGIATLFVQHTSCSLTINENASPGMFSLSLPDCPSAACPIPACLSQSCLPASHLACLLASSLPACVLSSRHTLC